MREGLRLVSIQGRLTKEGQKLVNNDEAMLRVVDRLIEIDPDLGPRREKLLVDAMATCLEHLHGKDSTCVKDCERFASGCALCTALDQEAGGFPDIESSDASHPIW